MNACWIGYFIVSKRRMNYCHLIYLLNNIVEPYCHTHKKRHASIKGACHYFVCACVDKMLIYFYCQYVFFFSFPPLWLFWNASGFCQSKPTHPNLKCEGKSLLLLWQPVTFLHIALLVGREWPFKLHIMDSLWAFMRAQEPKWKKGRAALKKCKMHLWQRLLT